MNKSYYPGFEDITFPFEVKAVTEEGHFEGYAAIFNRPDLHKEIIEPGAFTKTLQEGKTRPVLWYHNPMIPLGVTEVEADKKGLKVNGQLNMDVQAAREKRSLMQQGAIRGLSFGFKTIIDLWQDAKRILKEIKLYEISPVTFQMHPAALISAVKSAGPEAIEAAVKELQGNVKYISEYKAGKTISADNLKLINSAIKALLALAKVAEPSKDTQDEGKSIFHSVIGGLETENKPRMHLFGSTINTLENTKKE